MKLLRIAVADDEVDMRDYLQRILPRLGHEVVAACESGQHLVEACRKFQPDLVVTDIRMPEMDGIEAAKAIHAQRPIPIILVSAYSEPELVQRASDDQILAYLVKPVKRGDLETAIGIAVHRFEQFVALRNEASDLRQALADRKIIERAKRLLMKSAGLDEAAAFARMRRLANDRQLKLVDVASSILLASDALTVRRPRTP